MSDDAQCRQSQCYFSGCPPEYADLTDAIIVVDGAQFPVHMSVLAMRSGMLCRMLVDLRGEPANSGPLDLSTLFEGTSAPDVQLFLIHVYQAQQKIESWSEAFILAEFARKLDMTSMYDKIRGYVSEHVERLRPGVHTSAEQSLVEALILAVNHDWADVASKCETMICNNFYAVCSKTVLYTQIPPSSMQRIAVAMYNIALGEGVEWTCRCGQQNPREIRHCFQCHRKASSTLGEFMVTEQQYNEFSRRMGLGFTQQTESISSATSSQPSTTLQQVEPVDSR